MRSTRARFIFSAGSAPVHFGMRSEAPVSIMTGRLIFRTISTFDWTGKQHPEINDLVHNRIVNSLRTQLEAKRNTTRSIPTRTCLSLTTVMTDRAYRD